MSLPLHSPCTRDNSFDSEGTDNHSRKMDFALCKFFSSFLCTFASINKVSAYCVQNKKRKNQNIDIMHAQAHFLVFY